MVYTSAPETFEAPGLGVVAMTRDLPKPLDGIMRKLSRFDFFRETGVDPKEFVVCSHLTQDCGGQKWHILTRTCSAGLDYTSRNNFVSHHIALPDEMLRGGSTVFDYLLSSDLFRSSWSGPPQILEPRSIKPSRRAGSFPWSKTTAGKQGLQALVNWHQQEKYPIFLVADSADQALGALADAASQLGSDIANDISFITPLGADLRGVSFDWIGLVRGRGMAKHITDGPSMRMIDLNQPAPYVEEVPKSQPIVPDLYKPEPEPDETEEEEFFKSIVKPGISREKQRKESDDAVQVVVPPPPKRADHSMTRLVTFSLIGIGLVLGVIVTLVAMSNPEGQVVAQEEQNPDVPHIEVTPQENHQPNRNPEQRPGNGNPEIRKLPGNEGHPDNPFIKPPNRKNNPRENPGNFVPEVVKTPEKYNVRDEYICLDASLLKQRKKGEPDFVYQCRLLPDSTKVLQQLGTDGKITELKFSGKKPKSQIFVEGTFVADLLIEDDNQIVIRPQSELADVESLRICTAAIVLKNKEVDQIQRIYIVFNEPYPVVVNVDGMNNKQAADRWRSPAAQDFFKLAFGNKPAPQAAPDDKAKPEGDEAAAAEDSADKNEPKEDIPSDDQPGQLDGPAEKQGPEAIKMPGYWVVVHDMKIPFLANKPMEVSFDQPIPLPAEGALIPLNLEREFNVPCRLMVLHQRQAADLPLGIGLLAKLPIEPGRGHYAAIELLLNSTLSGQLLRATADSDEKFPVLLFGTPPPSQSILEPVPASRESTDARG